MKWTESRLRWYLEAGKRSEYPQVFIKRIKPYLRKEDILLDIGSGPGLFSRELASSVKKIYNLEPAPLPRKHLEKIAENCRKIEVISGFWPQELPGLIVDVTISAFSGAVVMADRESLLKIVDKTRRYIFLIAPAGPKDFGAGLENATPPLPYEHTEAFLKELNLKFHTELVSFDFGQPVADMEEATAFLAQQLRISHRRAREHAARIARPDGNGLYLPNPRQSALIRIDID